MSHCRPLPFRRPPTAAAFCALHAPLRQTCFQRRGPMRGRTCISAPCDASRTRARPLPFGPHSPPFRRQSHRMVDIPTPPPPFTRRTPHAVILPLLSERRAAPFCAWALACKKAEGACAHTAPAVVQAAPQAVACSGQALWLQESVRLPHEFCSKALHLLHAYTLTSGLVRSQSPGQGSFTAVATSYQIYCVLNSDVWAPFRLSTG